MYDFTTSDHQFRTCVVFLYRQDAAKRQTADIKFTGVTCDSQEKNHVFRPTGATRCTDSRQTWQGRGARGSAWLCKISRQSPQGVGMRPQKYKKNFHFLVKSRPTGATPLTDFENFDELLHDY